MKHATNNVDTFFAGSDSVDKIYHGADIAWQPTTAPTLLQETTWTLTTAGSASIASTGLDIIDINRTSSLEVGKGPRLFNGTEANKYGATNKGFTTGAACATWWQNYTLRLRQNGRDWVSAQAFGTNYVFTSCQVTYNNIGGAQTYAWGTNRNIWMDQDGGQTIDFEVYAAGKMPDNWYTYEKGAGTLPELKSSNRSITYDSNFPATNATQAVAIRADTTAGGIQGGGGTYGTAAAQWDYVAVFISDAVVADSFGNSWKTEGWYVFGPMVHDGSKPNWAPVAWPTGGYNGSGTGGVQGDSREHVIPVVFLNNYNGSTGNGGTDDWSAPLGSLLDWDTSPIVGHYASNAASASGQSTDVAYNPNTGVLDSYAQSGTPSIEPTKIGWSSTSAISLPMSNTINTTTFTAGLPFCAYWCSTKKVWSKGTAVDRGGFKTDMVYSMDRTLVFNDLDDPPACVLLYEVDPGDVSTWRPYDGPTS